MDTTEKRPLTATERTRLRRARLAAEGLTSHGTAPKRVILNLTPEEEVEANRYRRKAKRDANIAAGLTWDGRPRQSAPTSADEDAR